MPTLFESNVYQAFRDSVPLSAKQVGRRMVRGYGTATATARPLPDYLIIGAKRGGTTSLYRYLQQHPRVGSLFPFVQTLKGVYFFDEQYEKGVPWYRSHFPTRNFRRLVALRADGPLLVGESTPYYIFHPLAAERAAAAVPDARIVVLLRDPAERAWSHWKASRRGGLEPLSFEDALAAEPERLAGEEERIRTIPGYTSVAHRHLSYSAQSRYVHGLSRWLEHYPRDQVLVLRSEDLFRSPQPTVDEVFRFLGLPSHPLKGVRQWGSHSSDPSAPDVLADLRTSFREDNERLEELLRRPLGWSGAVGDNRR